MKLLAGSALVCALGSLLAACYENRPLVVAASDGGGQSPTGPATGESNAAAGTGSAGAAGTGRAGAAADGGGAGTQRGGARAADATSPRSSRSTFALWPVRATTPQKARRGWT